MSIKKPKYKKVSKVIRGNKCNNLCLLHNICPCQLITFYDCDRDCESFVGIKALCDIGYGEIATGYTQVINSGGISFSLEHYTDLVYEVLLKEMYSQCARCTHVDDIRLLKKNLLTIINDYAALTEKRNYVVSISTKHAALKFLMEQKFRMVDYRDSEGDIKYYITLPAGRLCTIENEGLAMNKLGTKPIILDGKFFLALKDGTT